ncbi:MAG: aminoglycoside phosphotransferase family protein [Leptolyngbya sp. Prado105]|jgi:hypothetical protein|nr:aminoglycoside phosphotransferase family protein [Leptolyngbya sp. Prado105]
MSIAIQDPFHILADPKLSFLAAALDPVQVQQQFQTQLFYRSERLKVLEIQAIRVIRYKPQRRCLIEYDVLVERSGEVQAMTWIAKVRSKGLDQSSYRLQQLLWDYGFEQDSADGISVPEPIGVIPQWRMWLQCKVPGVLVTEAISTSEGTELAQRIADAAHKLHCAWIMPKRCHGMKEEMAILHDRLSQVIVQFPHWQSRLERVLAQCDRLASSISSDSIRGIHRDFYPDQVLVDGSRLYLLDFDLFAGGDSELDIGNFNGHLIEQGLRLLGDPNAFATQQAALSDRFTQINREATRHTIEVYTTLTLVRHIYLSTQFPERQTFTAALVEHCEHRLNQPALVLRS